ncbi:MAG: hypothetical protein CYG61_05055 [Actinobacteria bacterium]|nr:MAG: hypothetical protein CYG61_05055 [Actinomycetota bacterium]
MAAASVKPARLRVVVVVMALLLAGAVADRADRPGSRLSTDAAVRALMPTGGPAGAVSSTWYCAGGTANAGGPAAAAIVIANPGDQEARASVLTVAEKGEVPPPVPVTVGARSVATVKLAPVATADHGAAVVEVDSGAVTVELVVGGGARTGGEHAASPCASSASSRWYFPGGSTAKDAILHLSLLNPFPEDAIADLSFATDAGRAVPADFQGIVVPARGLAVVDVGSHVRRREAVSTTVAVRSGRLVAAQTMSRTLPGRAGLSMGLGAPSPGGQWYFPDGVAGPGLAERYAIANPGKREATVLIEIALAEGTAEPLERTIPPEGRLDVVMGPEVGVPPGVAHAVAVRSLNGVPVVASRELEAAPPAPRLGRADTLGARRLARTWVFAAGGVTEALDEWVVVHNPGPRPARVSITGLAGGQSLALEGLQDLTIGPGRRQAFRLSDHVKRAPLPLVVSSSVPIVAERDLYQVGGPGLSATIGIPAGEDS